MLFLDYHIMILRSAAHRQSLSGAARIVRIYRAKDTALSMRTAC